VRLRTPSPPPDLVRLLPDQLPAARSRERWRARLLRGGAMAALVAVLATATWVVGYSDLLSADEVRVVGADGPLVEEVTDAAAVPFGQPLARVDTAGIAADVEAVPDVASATVTRGWPSTVVITVSPRVPVVSLAGEDGWYRVDSEGVIFAPGPAPAPALPVLIAPADADGLAARIAGVGVADVLPRPVLRQVERIEASSPVDVRLVLGDGRVVVWGSAEQADLKAEVLAVLLETPATEYDVSVPERPTLRPVATG
jgi:cell division protein FtsQ